MCKFIIRMNSFIFNDYLLDAENVLEFLATKNNGLCSSRYLVHFHNVHNSLHDRSRTWILTKSSIIDTALKMNMNLVKIFRMSSTRQCFRK